MKKTNNFFLLLLNSNYTYFVFLVFTSLFAGVHELSAYSENIDLISTFFCGQISIILRTYSVQCIDNLNKFAITSIYVES